MAADPRNAAVASGTPAAVPAAALDAQGVEPRVRTDATARGWRARLALEFRPARGRTVVARRHSGPLCIQRPFYPDDGACHVYVLHPPGGLAGGDQLLLTCAAEPRTAALVTTPAATKFYRSVGPWSRQVQLIHVARDASFEWLPLDTILFGGSRAKISTRIRLAPGARFAGWEMISIGRPLSGDRYRSGELDARTEIFVDGAPLLLDRTTFRAGDPILTRSWGLAGHECFGALYAYPADRDALALARERLAAYDALRAGATCVEELLVVRALAPAAETLREAFESAWAAVRAAVIGRAPSAPRIWRT